MILMNFHSISQTITSKDNCAIFLTYYFDMVYNVKMFVHSTAVGKGNLIKSCFFCVTGNELSVMIIERKSSL